MAAHLKTAFACLFLLAAAPLAAAQDIPDDPLVARVDTTDIRLSDLVRDQASLPEQYRQMPMVMLFDVLRTRAIESALLAAEAERQDLRDDPAVQQALVAMEQAVLRNRLVELTFAAAISEDKLRARYDELAAEPGFSFDQVRARHILVAEEDEALALIAELAEGADFAELARENSLDPAAANGGDLGYFVREQMVEPFATAAFEMEPGSFSEAPVETQFGWHVIKVEDRRTVTPSFEELVPDLRDALGRAAVTALLDGLRADAEIERFDMHGEPVPQAE